MFEKLAASVAEKLEIGSDKVGGIIEAIVDNLSLQGLGNFVTNLRAKGLGALVGGEKTDAISGDDTKSLFGDEFFEKTAAKVGVSKEKVVAATQELLPSIIGKLTPGGVIPSADEFLEKAGALFAGIAGFGLGTLGAVGGAVVDAADTMAGAVGNVAGKAGNLVGGAVNSLTNETVAGGSTEGEQRATATVARFGLYSVALLVLLSLGLAIAKPTVIPDAVEHHGVGHEGGHEGGHADGSHAEGAHGDKTHEAGAHDDASHSESSNAPQQTEPAPEAVPAPKAVAAPASAPAASPNAEAGEKAIEALAKDTSVTGEELVSALNLCVINFNTGSAQITPESMELLTKAATVIKKAPKETKIEIGGHTDNQGDANKNIKLSLDRANSVQKTLVGLGCDAAMFSTKGFGDSKSVADNATTDGRAKNRRMEFTLIN